MSSRDKTFLSSLGFDDPDKGNKLHDYACRYLTLPDVHMKIARSMLSESAKDSIDSDRNAAVPTVDSSEHISVDAFGGIDIDSRIAALRDLRRQNENHTKAKASTPPAVVSQTCVVGNAATEVVINKGDGTYATTVGFADAVLMHHVETTYANKKKAEPTLQHVVYAEVKIGKVSVAQILRQINLYRQYAVPNGRIMAYERCFQGCAWIIVTPWTMSSEDTDTLRCANVKHMLLGEDFKLYVEKRERDDGSREKPVAL